VGDRLLNTVSKSFRIMFLNYNFYCTVMQKMDIYDWDVLKNRLELEERGFFVAISNAFHGKEVLFIF
jgi:hypothetical protein